VQAWLGWLRPASSSKVETNSAAECAGWWSSDASHYFHTVTYHLDLVATLQSRGLSAAAAEALLESRPLFCFTAEAMALRDTDVRLQVRRPRQPHVVTFHRHAAVSQSAHGIPSTCGLVRRMSDTYACDWPAIRPAVVTASQLHLCAVWLPA